MSMCCVSDGQLHGAAKKYLDKIYTSKMNFNVSKMNFNAPTCMRAQRAERSEQPNGWRSRMISRAFRTQHNCLCIFQDKCRVLGVHLHFHRLSIA